MLAIFSPTIPPGWPEHVLTGPGRPRGFGGATLEARKSVTSRHAPDIMHTGATYLQGR